MKKILLTLIATVILASCNLGSLNYPQGQNNYLLEDQAGIMAYDGLSIPLQILNSIDWIQTDIFDPLFEGNYSLKTQKIHVERVPQVDSLWYFSSVESTDGIFISVYLKMLPSENPLLNEWEANGDFYYTENGSNYEALLSINAPIRYTWKDNVRTPGSYYEKYLVLNGSGTFTTRKSKTEVLNNGIYSLTDKGATPNNGYRMEGTLTLLK